MSLESILLSSDQTVVVVPHEHAIGWPFKTSIRFVGKVVCYDAVSILVEGRVDLWSPCPTDSIPGDWELEDRIYRRWPWSDPVKQRVPAKYGWLRGKEKSRVLFPRAAVALLIPEVSP
jgi:hypothetical protein